MKAAVLKSKNCLLVEEIDRPVPQAGEVLVRVFFTGVCGSDVPRVLEGKVHGYPLVLGHEFSGVVEEVGEGVDADLLGRRVAGVPLVPCGICGECVAGNYSLCGNYSFVGSRQNGSMAEYVCVPVSNVFVVDDGVSDVEAAFFEPATVGLHAANLVGFELGADVLVMGAGTIGLLLAQALVARGARNVVVCNRGEARLAVAKGIDGVQTICTASSDWRDEALAVTGGRGFDFVFDAVAASTTISDSFLLAAPRGTVCFVGTPKKDVSLPASAWEFVNRKELSVTGSWMSYSKPWPGSEWSEAARLFDEGKLQILPGMIDSVHSLDEIREAFDLFAGGDSPTGRVLVRSTI